MRYYMFTAGDVVKLKGVLSPRMTIDHINENSQACVIWFNYTNNSTPLHTDVFADLNKELIAVEALELVVEE